MAYRSTILHRTTNQCLLNYISCGKYSCRIKKPNLTWTTGVQQSDSVPCSSSVMTVSGTQYEKYLGNGKEIFETYCSTKDKSTIMLPRAPQQTYIDLYPDTDEPGCSFENDRQQQHNYEAEVIVYRALEKLNEELIVLHGFEYTHFQYHLGDSSHDKRKCTKCKKQATNREGECDFIVIAPNYFVVIEVKNMDHIGEKSDPEKEKKMRALTGTFQKSLQQRKKMVELIKRFCKRLTVLQFTVYPNFAQSFENQFQLSAAEKSTIIFKEDILDIFNWWKENVSDFVSDGNLRPEFHKKHEEVRNMLLAMWCTEKKTCDMAKCSLGRCTLNIDEQLRSGKFTFRCNNPEVVSTSKIVKDYLGIDNLTKEQNDLINSTEKFLWINGPAGAGKTVVLMARMLKLVLSSKENKVVLFNAIHPDGEIESSKYHQGTLEKAGITNVQIIVEEISDDPWELYTKISDNLQEYQVVVLVLKCFNYGDRYSEYNKVDDPTTPAQRLTDLFTWLKGVNIFFDDIQIMYTRDGGLGDDIRFIKTLLRRATSHQICVVCDMAQCIFFGSCNEEKRFGARLVKFFVTNSSSRPHQIVSLTKSLRNTFNLSKTLSEIRSRIVDICDSEQNFVNKLFPLQGLGHYIHGPKIFMHVLENFDKKMINGILTSKLDEFYGDKMIDMKTDLGIIYCHEEEDTASLVQDIINYGRSRSVDLKPKLLMSTSSMEWPAVIVLQSLCDNHNERELKVNHGGLSLVDLMLEEFSVDLEHLYFAMSRARVQCTVVMYPMKDLILDDFHRIKDLLKKLSDSVEIRRYPLTIKPQKYTHRVFPERPYATSLMEKALANLYNS